MERFWSNSTETRVKATAHDERNDDQGFVVALMPWSGN